MRIAAAVCSILAGLGFGIPCVFAIRHFARTGDVWTFMGFPTYGEGPFVRWGLPASTGLLVAFLVVCIAEVGLGVMILTNAPHTQLLGLVLLPVEMVFWIGFALPLGPVLGLARVGLLFFARPL